MASIPGPWRVLAGVLRGVGATNLAGMALGLVLISDPLPLSVLAQTLLSLTLLPLAAARCIELAFAAELEFDSGVLRLLRPGHAVTARADRIVGVRPWRIPLPAPGFVIRLATGDRPAVGPGARVTAVSVLSRDPGGLLTALEAAGADVMPARDSRTFAWAAARAARRPGWRRSPLVRQLAFALVPGGVGFYAHQHIAYGGLLGQFYLQGFAAWLATLVGYFALSLVYLIVWDAVCRAVVEIPAVLATAASPASAAAVRRAADALADVVYFVSVPSLLALRFLA